MGNSEILSHFQCLPVFLIYFPFSMVVTSEQFVNCLSTHVVLLSVTKLNADCGICSLFAMNV